LADDWTWDLFNLAVYAHMRSDDRLALPAAKMLAAVREAVQARAAKRGYPLPNRMPWQHRKPSYLEETAPIDALLADQERRAAERQAGRSPLVMPVPGDDPDATLAALKKALKQCPDKARRIALLVQELEEVSTRETDQSGNLDLASAPVIRLLIEEGEPAAEPLLACLEDDTRLTRSVHFHCHYDAGRYCELVGVPEAAYAAMAGILDIDFFGEAIPQEGFAWEAKPWRMALAKRIRGYFHKYRGLPREERWYRILLDDRAPMTWWAEAAEKIVGPAEAARYERVWIGGQLYEPLRKPPAGVKLPGEPLRGKKDPTVSELLAQRARELPPQMGHGVAMALAAWDPKAAVPVFRALSKEATGDVKRFVELILERMELHDPQAMNDYGQWVRGIGREQVANGWSELFAPLVRYPDHPAGRATAEWLFNDKDSPWNNVFRRPKQDKSNYSRPLLANELLVLPAFRAQVARLLADRHPAGHATMVAGPRVELKMNEEWSAASSTWGIEALWPAPGANAEFRVCDLAATELSVIDGLPRCELCWPEAKRDRAVAACAGLLRQYGHRFEGGQRFYFGGETQAVSIALPRLDHPATPEDVQAGRAIFTLTGQGAARVVPLAEWPAYARWSTLKDYPITRTEVDPKTRQQKTVAGFDQDGVVWQAEEVLQGGKWRRYFGFVGRHRLAKVPAEEIDFSWEGDSLPRLDGFQVFAVPPGQEAEYERPAGPTPPWTGGPLPLVVSIRNCTGLDRPLPRLVLDTSGAALPKDAVGLSVELFFDKERPGESSDGQEANVSNGQAKPPAWRQLARKAPLRLRSLDHPLRPTESFDFLRFDLRDHFQLAGKGGYRIVVKLATGNKRPEEQPSLDDEFFVDDKPGDVNK
jgi:hypothetical protein